MLADTLHVHDKQLFGPNNDIKLEFNNSVVAANNSSPFFSVTTGLYLLLATLIKIEFLLLLLSHKCSLVSKLSNSEVAYAVLWLCSMWWECYGLVDLCSDDQEQCRCSSVASKQ